MEKIQTVNFARYRMGESFAFNTMVADEFAKCNNAMFEPFAEKHSDALNEFDKALKKLSFTVESEDLSRLDYLRDNALVALDANVNHSLRCGIENRVEAARRLDNICTRYNNIKNLPYMEQTGMVVNMLQELATERSKSDLATIGAAQWVDDLQKWNDEFAELFSRRNISEAAIETGGTKRTRTELEAAYKAAVQCINTFILLNGFAPYAEIVNNINNLIERQKAVIKARSGKKKESEE